jgi:hypothetical protein
MTVAVACPNCKREIPVAEGQSGRWFVCPRCNETVFIPGPEDPPERARALNEPVDPEAEEAPVVFSPADRLGITALVLGTVSVLILCIPFVGLAAFALSSAGLTIGLRGLYVARRDQPPAGTRAARKRRRKGRAREFPVNYPLAGIVACLIALLLAFIPFLISSNSD